MGRWRAGQEPLAELVREVAEETGLTVIQAEVAGPRHEIHEGRPYRVTSPAVVVVGVGGSWPTIHLAFPCVATGETRPEPGHTADHTWFPTAEVARMLEEPAQFTGPTYAILTEWFG